MSVREFLSILAIVISAPSAARAEDVVRAYGPGGPAPAMKDGIWQVANPTLADQVRVSKRYVVYRDSGIALTRTGAEKPSARAFVEFLHSNEGAAIFERWGWTV